jgi:hypothetical protein
MVFKSQVLVVANVTATSRELLDVLSDRATRSSAAFTLLMPAMPGRDTGAGEMARFDEVITRLRGCGLEVDGSIAHGDPFVAVAEAWDPRRYDEIILSTLPASVSKWLRADLQRRIEKHTGALVTHVVAQPPKVETSTVQIPKREKRGVIAPFSVLTWAAAPRSHGGRDRTQSSNSPEQP